MKNDDLDINTPKGRKAASDQKVAADLFSEMTGFCCIATNDTGKAKIDGIIFRWEDMTLIAVTEIKTRYNCTIHTMRTAWKNEWLVTEKKILDLSYAAVLLDVPGYGIVHFPDDKSIMSIRICDRDGKMVVPYRVAKTRTKETVNGGSVLRDNAYIRMDSGKVWSLKR